MTQEQYLTGADGAYPNDEGRKFATASTAIAAITFDGAQANAGAGGFGPPVTPVSLADDGWFGVSCEGSSVLVPEPTAALLLGIGLAGLALRGRLSA